jgi:predicted nucleic acid-binding protein
VAAKWFFPEIHAEHALQMFRSGHEAAVPDLLFAEFGSIIHKRVRSGSITVAEARILASGLDAITITLDIHSTRPLLPAALEIAHLTDASVYESLYVALAQHEGIQCVTADRKLYDRIAQTELGGLVMWIEAL